MILIVSITLIFVFSHTSLISEIFEFPDLFENGFYLNTYVYCIYFNTGFFSSLGVSFNFHRIISVSHNTVIIAYL